MWFMSRSSGGVCGVAPAVRHDHERRRTPRTRVPQRSALSDASNKSMLPSAPTSLIPTSLAPSSSRPRPTRPSTTSLFAVLPAASRASRHHLALRSSPGHCPCVPPPPRSSQFFRPRPVRPITTSLFAVLSAAFTAFFHHLALRVPGGRVPCAGPTRLVRGRHARRPTARREQCGKLGACWGSSARVQRAHGVKAPSGTRTRRARGGARCHAAGRTAGGRKGAERTAQGRTATG